MPDVAVTSGDVVSVENPPALKKGGICVGKVKGDPYNDTAFQILREHFGVQKAFEEGGTLDTQFDFEWLADGGGKGGNPDPERHMREPRGAAVLCACVCPDVRGALMLRRAGPRP